MVSKNIPSIMETGNLEALLLAIEGERLISFNRNEQYFWHAIKPKVYSKAVHYQQTETIYWILFDHQPLTFLIEFLALCLSGKKVILPPNNKPQTLNKIIELISGQVNIVDPDTRINETTISQNNSFEDTKNSQIILFTSGSSGEPKQVIKKFINLSQEVLVLSELWNQSQVRVYSSISHQHLYGLIFRLLWPFFCGRAFANFNIQYPEEVAMLEQGSVFVSSPALLSRLDTSLDYPNLSAIFSSGGPLAPEHAESVKYLLKRYPVEIYGSTETGGIAHRVQQHKNEAWSLMPKLMIRQKQNAVILNSPFIYQKELLLDDKIEMLDNKHFRLLGRKDRVIKLEEKRVSLEHLETLIKEMAWVTECRCIQLNDIRSSLAAVVVLSSEGLMLLEQQSKYFLVKQLKQKLLTELDLVVLPRKWRFIDKMPVNTMSKIIVDELKELFQ